MTNGRTKTLQELMLIEDFLFGEVMQDNLAAQYLLEIILDVKIKYVRQSNIQQPIKTDPNNHGIRLDVYIEDDKNTVYNVEVQKGNKYNIPKRSRYYKSLIDFRKMKRGQWDYNILPPSYVIFICDFDYFKQERYLYTFENRCIQDLSLPFNDGTVKMVLYTDGTNDDEVPPMLIKLLRYIKTTTEETAAAAKDRRIDYLQSTVNAIKRDPVKEANYMLFEEKMALSKREGEKLGLRKGRREGRLEGELKGELKGKRETARNLLAEGLDVRMIARATGLTAAEVEALKK